MIKTNSTDDLRTQLTLIDRDKLQAFIEAYRAVPKKPSEKRKRVIVVAMGGTLAMREGADGVCKPDLFCDGLLQTTSTSLLERFELLGFDAMNIDSSQMCYAHCRELAIALTILWRELDPDSHIGFLITHGTDTLSFASSTLSLMLGQGLPFSVVYTAAQKPITHPLSDAPRNIRNSLFTLEALHDEKMAEVVVCVGDYAMLATSSEKVHDLQYNAFSAPLHGYVARFDTLQYPLKLAKWLKPARENVDFAPVIWTHNYSSALVIRSALGLDPEMVRRQVDDAQVRGVILYSYAAGTVDDTITNAIMDKADEKGVPVFVVSPVNSRYKVTYESGQYLLEQGVQPLLMTISAAMAKFEVALCLFGEKPERIKAFMAENYVGEVPEHFLT